MGGHDDGGPLRLNELFEDSDDLEPHRRVQLCGRLVGKDGGGPVGDGPRDGDPLLLAARQFLREVIGALGKADQLEAFKGPFLPAGSRAAGDPEPELDIFEGSHARHQGDRLEDDPDPGAADLVPRPFAEGGELLSFEKDLAGGRAVEGAQKVDEGRFARPGFAV